MGYRISGLWPETESAGVDHPDIRHEPFLKLIMNDQVRDRMFRFLDSNGNKKISRTGLGRIILFAPELKDRPDRIDNLFELIDIDEDQFLDPSEFDASSKIAG